MLPAVSCLQAAEAKLVEEQAKRTAAEEATAALAAGLTEAIAIIDEKDQGLAVCCLDALPLRLTCQMQGVVA